MPLSTFQALEQIARHLPFHLSDVVAANEAYVAWRESGDPDAGRTVELWTYCFILRYFLVKFSRDGGGSPADVDEIVERCYQRVEEFRDGVEDPSRYANWVSVVCRNLYLNYLRSRRRSVPIDGDGAPTLVAETPATYNDVELVHQGLLLAICRLPDHLQDMARLRFVEERGYEEIARLTGRSVGTVRTYVNKAARRLRKDGRFLEYLERPEEDHE